MAKARRLVLQATVMGMTADICTIKIGGYAKQRELREWTKLVCGKCKEKPRYHNSHYECSCGASYTSWQKLLRVRKDNGEPVEMPKLTKGNGEIEKARLFQMPFEKFKKFVDAIDPKEPDRFIIVEDETSRKNLFKMLVAHEELKVAIIIKYNDTYEQRIALLTTTVSGRIVLRYIIPQNLLTLAESQMLEKNQLTEKDIQEAKMFLKQLPEATEEDLCVEDYRKQALEVVGEAPKEKVEKLAVIIAKAKAKKKAK